jgi:hypothetical protein
MNTAAQVSLGEFLVSSSGIMQFSSIPHDRWWNQITFQPLYLQITFNHLGGELDFPFSFYNGVFCGIRPNLSKY